MGTLSDYTSSRKLLKVVKLCDIVEFNRITYSHYGIYIGDGICVHVQGPSGQSFSSSSALSGDDCKSGTKVAQLLVNIAAEGAVRINNSDVYAFQHGIKTRNTSDAITLATEKLPRDSDGKLILGKCVPVRYMVISKNNCEGWATYWKYDHPTGWSIQAANGFFSTTAGTIGRTAEVVVWRFEEGLENPNNGTGLKLLAATGVFTYKTLSYGACAVTKTTNFIAGIFH